MKLLFLLIALFSVSAKAAEHNLLIGLYTYHHVIDKYVDYRERNWQAGDLKTINQGGPKANQIIGYQYLTRYWSGGICSFKNSFYERTHCAFGAIHYPVKNWSVIAGINITYGYRPALVSQDHNASMSKAFIPVSFVGVRTSFSSASITWQWQAPRVSTLVLGIRI